MAEQSKYSLWLMPEGETYKTLQELIKRLAKGHGAPVFEPHLTLLGGITSDDEEDVLRRTHILGSRVESPFDVTLGDVWYKDEFYRSLFIKAEPTGALVGANVDAKLAMAEICKPDEFYPHLSLMYGDFFPMIKEAIIADIGAKFDITFRVSSIKLMRTDGGPSDWKGVGVIRLQ